MYKSALITGAAGGIGRELCAKFSKNGYAVLAIDKRDDPGVECEKYLSMDLDQALSTSAQAISTISYIRECLSGNGLTVLVNNAANQIIRRTEDLTHEEWERSLSTNLSVPFYLIQALIPNLEAANGSVVNVGSIHSTLTKPGFVAYSTSKSALIGLTKALAVDLGGRVRVNAISPAAVDTPMLRQGFAEDPDLLSMLSRSHPIGRIGESSEIASVALFLASDCASYVTGANISVDGGISSRLHDPA